VKRFEDFRFRRFSLASFVRSFARSLLSGFLFPVPCSLFAVLCPFPPSQLPATHSLTHSLSPSRSLTVSQSATVHTFARTFICEPVRTQPASSQRRSSYEREGLITDGWLVVRCSVVPFLRLFVPCSLLSCGCPCVCTGFR